MLSMDWSVTFPPEIIYYMLIPIIIAIVPIIFAWIKRHEVTAVHQYVLDELKDDVKDLKERIRTLELLSPGSLITKKGGLFPE